MTNYLVSIQHPTIGMQPVTLLGIENAQLVTELESGAVYYRKKLGGSFKLKNGAGMLNSFDSIYSILTGADKCEKIAVTVQERCPDGSISDLFLGKMEVKDVCIDKCLANVSIEQDDIFSCIKDNWEKETNHFDVATVTSTTLDSQSVIEEHTCNSPTQIFVPLPPFPNYLYYVCPFILEQSGNSTAEANAYAGLNIALQTADYTVKWCIKSTTDVNTVGNNFVTVTTKWWREVRTVASSTIMPSPWQLLDDNGITARWWRCPYSSDGQVIIMDNGRLFNDILQYTVDDAVADCGVCQVVSDFLNINSMGVSISNDAYDNAFKVQKMIVYQQSDVKRFNAFENAGEGGNTAQFVWSLKDQLEFLANTLNCYWDIEETGDPLCPYIFRVEHISYFAQQGVVDLTNEFARNCYSYKKENAPQTEEFKWRNPTDNPVFAGTPITYASACTLGKKSYSAGVNTDIIYIANPSNEDKVPDDGFVVVAGDYIDSSGNYVINAEAGIISGIDRLNAALSWENIHERYWRHDRSLLAGNMNGINTSFYTAKFPIAAEEIRKKLCCGGAINTNANYLTKPGTQPHIAANGRLKRFALDLKTRTGIYEIEHSYA